MYSTTMCSFIFQKILPDNNDTTISTQHCSNALSAKSSTKDNHYEQINKMFTLKVLHYTGVCVHTISNFFAF